MRNKCVSKFSASRIMRKKICEHADNTMKIGIIKVNFAPKKGRCGACVCVFFGLYFGLVGYKLQRADGINSLANAFLSCSVHFSTKQIAIYVEIGWIFGTIIFSFFFTVSSAFVLSKRSKPQLYTIYCTIWNWQTDLKIKLEKKNWRCRNFIRPIWWIHWFDFGTIGKGNKKTRKDSQITVLGSISKFIKTPEKYSWNTHSHTRSLHYTNKLD